MQSLFSIHFSGPFFSRLIWRPQWYTQKPFYKKKNLLKGGWENF